MNRDKSDRKFEIKVKVIYAADYKYPSRYQYAIERAEGQGYENILESTGWYDYGAYCILRKEIEHEPR